MKPPLRTKSVGTKVSEAELALLEERARGAGMRPAELGKTGSCHTMARLMHRGGADIRVIPQMLGHEDIKTPQIYMPVAIRALQQIHAATHPGAMPPKRKNDWMPKIQKANESVLQHSLSDGTRKS